MPNQNEDWWAQLAGFLEAFDQTKAPRKPVIPGAPKEEPKLAPKPKAPQQPGPDELGAPPVTTKDRMSVIEEAGRRNLIAMMLYNGMWRGVEPYSWKHFTTGLRLYAFCHRHQHIELFDPGKIEDIQLTNRPFKPKWSVQVGL